MLKSYHYVLKTMYLQNILKKFALWVKNKMTLERAWYLFVISLILFVIFSIIYPDTFRLTLGISVLTIAMMYLIMVSSNIELQTATQTQVKVFVEQLQTLGNELKNVSQGIRTLTQVMIDVKTTLLESTLVSKTAIAKAEIERRKRKESIKPQLSVMVEIRGIFWRHYHVLLSNSGSDAIGTIIRIGNQSYGTYNIGVGEHIDIDIGHINNFQGIPSLSVFLETRDVDRNPYQGQFQVSLPQPQWASIPLVEI